MHRQIQTGHHVGCIAAEHGGDIPDYTEAVQNGCGQRRCTDAVLLIGLGVKVRPRLQGLFSFFASQLLQSALAHGRILPTFWRAVLEGGLVLNVVQGGLELKTVVRKGADVVALLLANTVLAEAVREVHIPGSATALELGVGRQALHGFLVGANGIRPLLPFASGSWGSGSLHQRETVRHAFAAVDFKLQRQPS